MAAPHPLLITRKSQQPQQPVPIDWLNPITRGLVIAYVLGGSGAFGYGDDGRTQLPYLNTSSIVTATPVITNLGFGAKIANTNYPILNLTQRSLANGTYSLFAAATAPGNSATQSAIDDDDSTTRRFQFRLNGAAPEFIPFNSGGAAVIVTGMALPSTSLAGGFTMGATANSTTAAVWSNGRKTSANASGILTPNSSVWVGNRKTAANAWVTGAISLMAVWNRVLTDMEMQSLAINPWQLFKTPSNLSLLTALTSAPFILRKALYIDSNDIVRQSTGGLNVKPLVLINGILRPQVTNETPVVLVNGQLRQLKAGETLVL